MPRVRIVVVGLHELTAELVKEVYDQHPETVVAGIISRRRPLPTVVAEHRPDLLITAVADEAFQEFDAVLDVHPRLTLLAVDADGRRSFLYRLLPKAESLGELSAETLLDAARAAVPTVS